MEVRVKEIKCINYDDLKLTLEEWSRLIEEYNLLQGEEFYNLVSNFYDIDFKDGINLMLNKSNSFDEFYSKLSILVKAFLPRERIINDLKKVIRSNSYEQTKTICLH